MNEGLKLIKKMQDLRKMIATAEAGIKALDYISTNMMIPDDEFLEKLENKYEIKFEELHIYDKLMTQYQKELESHLLESKNKKGNG
jgi:hypothetical protein